MAVLGGPRGLELGTDSSWLRLGLFMVHAACQALWKAQSGPRRVHLVLLVTRRRHGNLCQSPAPVPMNADCAERVCVRIASGPPRTSPERWAPSRSAFPRATALLPTSEGQSQLWSPQTREAPVRPALAASRALPSAFVNRFSTFWWVVGDKGARKAPRSPLSRSFGAGKHARASGA